MTVDERLKLARRIPADAATISIIAASAGVRSCYATAVDLKSQALSLIWAAERHGAVDDLLKVLDWIEAKGVTP